MIHVDRKSVPGPAELSPTSLFVKKSWAAAGAFCRGSHRSRRQRRLEISLEPVRVPVTKALLRMFHGKCAYCEAKVVTDQHGDVEHFRPKGAVTDEDLQPIMVQDTAGNSYPHPGYFWLAYEHTNLLLSCCLCNQPSTDTDERRLGKRNRFPLLNPSVHATKPDDVGSERPLLLNPLTDDPTGHFELDPDPGRLIGLTPEGKKCVEVFDLNDREGISKEIGRTHV